MSLLTKLGEALQRAGFSKELAPVLKAEKEEEIDETIEVLKQSGVKQDKASTSETLIQSSQTERSLPQEQKLGSSESPPDQSRGNAQEMPAWAGELYQKLEALSEARQGELKRTQAQALLSKSSLPEDLKNKWLSRLELQGEIPLEGQIKALEEEYGNIEKSLLSQVASNGLPLGGSSPQISEGQVENIIANL